MAFKPGFIVIDRGCDKIMRQLKLTDKSYVKVGVQAGAEHKPSSKGSKPKDTTDMVAIAVANEFGTKGIPERSFLRSTTDEQQRELIVLKVEAIRRITIGRTTVKKQLDKIGLYLGSKVQNKIKDLRTPPNALSTVRAKGSSSPLVDTGQLRASIRHVVHVIE